MINQVGIHLYLVQQELMDYLQLQNIAIEVLARGRVNDESILSNIANKYHNSPSQITLRWQIKKGSL